MERLLMIGSLVAISLSAFAFAHLEMARDGEAQSERAARMVFAGKCERGEVHCIRDENCVQMVLEGVPTCYTPPKCTTDTDCLEKYGY